MNKVFLFCLLICTLVCRYAFSADTIYIVGIDNADQAGYWSIFPPNSPSTFQPLDSGGYTSGNPRSLAFSQNQTVYIVGNSNSSDTTLANYWTISSAGNPSVITPLTATSDAFVPTAQKIAFNPSGVGYIVGVNEFGNPVYWTVSTSGMVSSAVELAVGGYASAVGFTASGVGYIAGLDSLNNVIYWTISPAGVVSGPIELVGGEAGGVGSAYDIATSPSGTTYIVGSNTGGFACYWTISNSGIASAAIVLDGGFNSMARGVAFVPSGEGIIVGQGTNNLSCYWLVSANGSTGSITGLPNGSENGSCAYGVAFSSDETAYIVGLDNANQAVYWTLPLSNPVPEYHLLDNGLAGIAYAIAIYFPITPNPSKDLSGKYVTDDFGWAYERYVLLNWTLSSSSNAAAYNIYKNGVKIATVSSPTATYKDYHQKKSHAVYAVTAVDGAGHESSQTTITVN